MQQHFDDFLPKPSLSTVSWFQATFFCFFFNLIVAESAGWLVDSSAEPVRVVVAVVVRVVVRAGALDVIVER